MSMNHHPDMFDTSVENNAIQFDAAMLAEMATDPETARELEELQIVASNELTKAAEEIARMLARNEPARTPELNHRMMTITALKMQSRQGEVKAAQRRELATGLLIGSMLNQGNPDWNPADPDTHHPTNKSALAALLTMGSASAVS